MTENKIEKIISILPNNSKKEIRAVLKRKIFTQEICIPKDFNKIKKNNSKKDLMINTIYNFNTIYKKRNKYLSQLFKEDSEFSKGHSVISIISGKNKSKGKLIYSNLMQLYANKGYDSSKLLTNNNIFDDSILLTNNSYTNIIRIIGEKEVKKDEKSLKILNNYTKINKERKNFDLEDLKSDEDNKKNLLNDNYKKNNLLLKYDILRTKQSINNLLISELRKNNRTFSNIRLNKNYSNSESENKLNSSNDNISYEKNNHTNQTNLSERNKIIFSNQAFNFNKYKRNNTFNISQNFSSDNELSSFNKKELKKTFSLNNNKNERKISFIKLHKKNKNNYLTELYENIKKTNYKENKKNISKYLSKNNIKIKTPLK